MSVTLSRIGQTVGWENSRPEINRSWLAKVDDGFDAPDDNTNAVAVAAAAEAIPSGYYIVRIKAEPVNRSAVWYKVDICYQIPLFPDLSPLLRPSTLSGSYDEFEEPYFVDSFGTKVLNAAHEQFDPLPTRRNGKPILQITKNLSTYPLAAYDALKYTTSADVLTIKGTTYDSDTTLFLPPIVSEQYEQVQGVTYHYFATTFRLALDHAFHLDKVANRGFDELDSHMKRVPIICNGMAVSSPWPLKSDGTSYADPSMSSPPITFAPYASVSWGIDFN